MLRLKLMAENMFWFGLMFIGRTIRFVITAVWLILETVKLPIDLCLEHRNGKDPEMSVITRYGWSNRIAYEHLTDIPKGLIMWGLDLYTVVRYGHHFIFC